MPNGQDFERMKFELEKRKVELEEQKSIRESRFFNKHFGVIITSIISAATIIVSVTQLLISSSYNATQLKNEIEKTKRSFDFEVAKFLMEKGADIITTDVGKAQYIRAVVLSSFPTEVATRVSTSMRDISPAIEIRNVWSESCCLLTISGPGTNQAVRLSDKFAFCRPDHGRFRQGAHGEQQERGGSPTIGSFSVWNQGKRRCQSFPVVCLS